MAPKKDTKAAAIKQRTVITLATKLDIIAAFSDKRLKQKDVAERFKLSEKTVQRIWSYRDKYLNAVGTSSLKSKHLYEVKYDKLDVALFQWFEAQREKQVPPSGPQIRAQALQMAPGFGYHDFKASHGWLNKWKLRHDIVFRNAPGKASGNEIDVWIKHVCPELKAPYEAEDASNKNETTTSHHVTPIKPLLDPKGPVCRPSKYQASTKENEKGPIPPPTTARTVTNAQAMEAIKTMRLWALCHDLSDNDRVEFNRACDEMQRIVEKYKRKALKSTSITDFLQRKTV